MIRQLYNRGPCIGDTGDACVAGVDVPDGSAAAVQPLALLHSAAAGGEHTDQIGKFSSRNQHTDPLHTVTLHHRQTCLKSNLVQYWGTGFVDPIYLIGDTKKPLRIHVLAVTRLRHIPSQ